MMSSDFFVSSSLAMTEGSLKEVLVLGVPISDGLFRLFKVSELDAFCTGEGDVSDLFPLLSVGDASLLVLEDDEACCGGDELECFELSGNVGGSGFFWASLFKILLSVIRSRAATGGRLIRVDGKRVTSFFISESNSSSWLRTKTVIFRISIFGGCNKFTPSSLD